MIARTKGQLPSSRNRWYPTQEIDWVPSEEIVHNNVAQRTVTLLLILGLIVFYL